MTVTSAAGIIIPKTEDEELLEKVGPLIGKMEDFEFFHNAVVVAKFIRSKIGSLYTAKETRLEDRYQGKVGIVLSVGPSAFVNEQGFDFHGASVKPGDWVMFRNTDGWDFDYHPDGKISSKIELRLLEDAHIKGVVKRPDLIW